MSGISMGGMGTGLDIHGLAGQMATIQITPKANQLTRRETGINEEIAALNELTSSLNSFYNTLNKYSDVTRFGSVSVNMSEDDEKYASISADETAIANTYSLQVKQLAQQHKVEFLAIPSENEGVVGPNKDGEYTIMVDGQSMKITLEKDDTVTDVVTKINEHPDNPGVTASLLSDDKATYITLTSDETGTANAIDVEKTGDPSYEALKMLDPEDAKLVIDGKPVTSSSNTVENAIPGVSINLKSTTEEAFTFKVEPDTSKMSSSASAMVDAYNDVLSTLDSLGNRSMDDNGNVVSGPLAGDPMVNAIRNELRGVTHLTFDGPYPTLASVGIITTRDGDLEVDSDMLKEALEDDPQAVTEMFLEVAEYWQDVSTKYIGRPEEEEDDEDPETQGLESASSSSTSDGKYIPKDGLIDARMETLERNQRAVEDEWKVLETRYESIYQRHLNELIAMDLAVAKMQGSMGFM